MFVKFTFLIICLGLLVRASSTVELIKRHSKPTHHIVWIHGIGGNAKQAGFIKEALEAYLPGANPKMNYSLSFFDYATKNDNLTYEDFRKAFDSHLQKKFFKETPFKNGDQFSIIAHSQGGIISLLWMNSACFDKSKPSYKLCAKLKSFSTLGTPIWGSRMANLAESLKRVIGNTWIMKDYGLKQLAALSVASPLVFELRQFLEMSGPNFKNLFSGQVRYMAVAGRSSLFKSLKLMFPGQAMEDDLGVPVTSANPNYYKLTGEIGDQKTFVQSQYVNWLSARFAIVDAIHIPQLPNLIRDSIGEDAVKWVPDIKYPSLIDIPQDCVTLSPEKCSSPTLKFVASNILGDNRKIENENLKSFAIQVRLKASKNSDLNNLIRFKITAENDGVEVGKWYEPYSNLRNIVGNNIMGYITGGKLKEISKAQLENSLNFEIYVGINKFYSTKLKVSPGYTTFVDLVLDEESLMRAYEQLDDMDYLELNRELGILETAI